MPSPDKIHINWNASDGFEYFEDYGIPAQYGDTLTPDQITLVLARQAGKLFRLLGWSDNPRCDIALSITGHDDSGLQVSNHTEPPFSGAYTIAADPPPHITGNGDYLFDLTRVE